jgi:hypothetical protein
VSEQVLTVIGIGRNNEPLAALLGTLTACFRPVQPHERPAVAWVDAAALPEGETWPAQAELAAADGARAVLVHRPTWVPFEVVRDLEPIAHQVVLLGSATHAPALQALVAQEAFAAVADLVELVLTEDQPSGPEPNAPEPHDPEPHDPRNALLDMLLTLGAAGLAPKTLERPIELAHGVRADASRGATAISVTALNDPAALPTTRLTLFGPGHMVEMTTGQAGTASPGTARVITDDSEYSPPLVYETPARWAMNQVWDALIMNQPLPGTLASHREAFALIQGSLSQTQEATAIRAWSTS